MNPKILPHAIKIIIGLGNPTDEYKNTYHNVGKLALAYFLSNIPPLWEISESRSPKKSFSYTKLIGSNNRSIICIEPHTFMNESGRAVQDTLLFFKLPLSSLLVLHDDSDMTIGTYKFSHDQRSAGHRGIESIIKNCGSKEFYRGKIGIRPAQEVTRKKADEFVLRKISKKDMILFEEEIFPKIISTLTTEI